MMGASDRNKKPLTILFATSFADTVGLMDSTRNCKLCHCYLLRPSYKSSMSELESKNSSCLHPNGNAK